MGSHTKTRVHKAALHRSVTSGAGGGSGRRQESGMYRGLDMSRPKNTRSIVSTATASTVIAICTYERIHKDALRVGGRVRITYCKDNNTMHPPNERIAYPAGSLDFTPESSSCCAATAQRARARVIRAQSALSAKSRKTKAHRTPVPQSH